MKLILHAASYCVGGTLQTLDLLANSRGLLLFHPTNRPKSEWAESSRINPGPERISQFQCPCVSSVSGSLL